MNNTAEGFQKYYSNIGIYKTGYIESQKTQNNRRFGATLTAFAKKVAARARAIPAVRVGAVLFSATGLAAVIGLLEVGILPLVPAFLLGAFSAGILCLFLKKNKRR